MPNPGAGPAVASDHDVGELSTAVVKTAVTRRRPRCNTHPDDKQRLNEILNDFKRSATAGQPAERRLKPASAISFASTIRGFSSWLYGEKKPGIVVRPHDRSLNEDAELYRLMGGDKKIIPALAHLRNFMFGNGAPKFLGPRLAAYPEDAALIQEAVEAAKADIVNGTPWQGFKTPRAIGRAASILRGFSEWLKTHAKSAIAGRLDDASLQEDGKTFRRIRGDYSLRLELKLLWTYDSLREFPTSAISDSDLDLLELLEQEIEVDRPPSTARDIAPQHTLLQAAPAAAAISDDGLELRTRLALLEQEMEVDGPTQISWEGDPQLNSFQESLEQLLVAPGSPLELPLSPLPYPDGSSNFDTALRGEVRNDSHDSRASRELRQPQHSSHPVAAIPAWAPAYDFGHVVALGFNHGPQPAPDVLIGALNRRGMLPQSFQQSTNLIIHGQPYMAVLGPGMREVPPNNPFSANIILRPRFKGG
ncbi:hypothetical protein H8A97_25230 [Bradyrhizobium sp. Arg62]|uniref:hypothetical protein n=1 Tax=Bradyrhizobium TaxID=374 RepID=UPI001E28B1D4|nr:MULTISPECIES: hypothetical protein [Bradyrhizobium]MCC8938376.1 hypothetical protein [Bradyrhizobium ivorense]MCC8948321.1 hypothetical protein [Bradyrhizobium brasilense]